MKVSVLRNGSCIGKGNVYETMEEALGDLKRRYGEKVKINFQPATDAEEVYWSYLFGCEPVIRI